MHLSRTIIIAAIVLLVLWGALMAFDQRFLSFAQISHRPARALYIYAPTIIFAVLSATQLRRGRAWPALAFAGGLVGTGLFHQSVAKASHGNPGYMFPTGHIVAPLVSAAAYLICILVAWLVVKLSRR